VPGFFDAVGEEKKTAKGNLGITGENIKRMGDTTTTQARKSFAGKTQKTLTRNRRDGKHRESEREQRTREYNKRCRGTSPAPNSTRKKRNQCQGRGRRQGGRKGVTIK